MKLRLGVPPARQKSCCLANHSPRAQALIRASPSPIQACVEPASSLRAVVPLLSVPCALRLCSARCELLVCKTVPPSASSEKHHVIIDQSAVTIVATASLHTHRPDRIPSRAPRASPSPCAAVHFCEFPTRLFTRRHPRHPRRRRRPSTRTSLFTFGPTTTRVALCSAGTRGLSSSSSSHPPTDRHRQAHRLSAVPASPRTSLRRSCIPSKERPGWCKTAVCLRIK